jgi:hypothetical protein
MKKIYTFIIVQSLLVTLTCIAQPQGQWTWMNGSSAPNPTAVYGSKDTFAANNTPQNFYEACEWTDHNGNFWLFGGVYWNTLNQYEYADLWEFKPSINQWCWIKGPGANNAAGVYGTRGVAAPSNNPGARGFGAATWVDTAGNLWLFGGWGHDINGTPGTLDDLWKFNIADTEWTWMKGSNLINGSISYGTKGIEDSTNQLPPREETNASWTDDNNNLWIFGGLEGASNYVMSDLWRFNISTNNWTWINGPILVNQPAVYGTLYHPDSTNTPGARAVYSKWKDCNGDFWLFGGLMNFYNNLTFNDMWRYNIASNKWTWMGGTNTLNNSGTIGALCATNSTNVPQSRFENRACWTRGVGNFELYGGSIDTNGFYSYSDIWDFSVSTGEWTLIAGYSNLNIGGTYGTRTVSNANNLPAARMGSIGWKDNNGFLWLFGGWDYQGNYHNDMWRYVPDTTCPALTDCNITTGIKEVNPKSNVSLYPNPNNGNFTLSYHLSNPNNTFQIIDVTGRIVYTTPISGTEGAQSISVSDLSNGIYHWQLLSDKNILDKGKIAILH